MVQYNVEFIKGTIVNEKPNYEIIESIENVLEIISDDNDAQLYTLWKIYLFIADKLNNYFEAIIALNKAKRILLLNITEEDLDEERQLMAKANNLEIVFDWIKDLYEKLKDKEEIDKSGSILNSEKILEKLSLIEEKTQIIEDNTLEISESLNSKFDTLLKKIKSEHIILIEKITSQLKSVDSKSLKTDWDNGLYKETINQLITKINQNSLSQEEQNVIIESINNPEISVKHKLKFILPLFFFKYEGEIEFGEKQKFPRSWNEFKKILIRDEKDFKT